MENKEEKAGRLKRRNKGKQQVDDNRRMCYLVELHH
jgi:hypothetical protein